MECKMRWIVAFVVSAPLFALSQTNYTPYTFITYAGTPGNHNYQDGTGAGALFNGPGGVMFDASTSNILVADQNNNLIRQMDNKRRVTTIAGLVSGANLVDGTNSGAHFKNPSALAQDSNGNIFIADLGNNAIRKMILQGTNWIVTTIAGNTNAGSMDGTNGDALFNLPHDVAVDPANNLFVADENSYAIRKIVADGTNWIVTTIAGQLGVQGVADGVNSNALFYRPWTLAIDANSNIFVGDLNAVRKISPVGTDWVVTTIAGSVTNFGFVDGTNDQARFGGSNSTIFGGIHGIEVDSAGNLFAADTGSQTIRKITPSGTNWVVTTLGGAPNAPGINDGSGNQVQFNGPCSVALDSFGNLFVADFFNSTVRKGFPFAITHQPDSTGSPAGTNATLTVGLYADRPVTYQWFFGSSTLLVGQTNATLLIPSAQRTNNGNYFVKVTGMDTNDVVQTKPVQLRILYTPVLQPLQIVDGTTVRLQFQDSDGGIPFNISKVSVQWRTNLPVGIDTNWQTLGGSFYFSNGFLVLDNTSSLGLPGAFYRVIEF